MQHLTEGSTVKAEETETGAINFYIGDPMKQSFEVKQEVEDLEARLHEVEVNIKAAEEGDDINFLKRDRVEIMAKLEALRWVLES